MGPAASGMESRRVGRIRVRDCSTNEPADGSHPPPRGGSGPGSAALGHAARGGGARSRRPHPRLPVGPWDVSRLAAASGDHIGLLILDGVLARELLVADQISAELLGPGDVVRPWQGAARAALLPADAVWSVLSSLTVAVLDRRFAAEAARYPEITAALFDRLGERSLRLATTQAISQLTRVDRRLKALFWHLAERWGRVSGDGVVVPLALTHRILGQL